MPNMMDERAQRLLKTLIERYIADGQPVGSRALSKLSGLELSPATIRNVMADLEEMGFVSSPHTSAGRIPTPRGYRLFVDSMLTVQPLEQTEAITHTVQDQLQSPEPQRVIAAAAQVLSNLSQFAGVVATPRRSNTFKQIEFMKLSDKRILLIIVTPAGDVQNRIILTEKDYTSTQLIEAANYLNAHFMGLSFDQVRTRLRGELKELQVDMSVLMQAAVNAGDDALSNGQEDVVISGEARLLDVEDLSANMGQLRKLFGLFEQKTSLLQLLDISNRAEGVQIFIGGESQLVPLDELSIVTAPYEVNGQIVGTLGVIGPTRMAYERVIPIVDITAKMLTNALNQP